MLLWLGLMSAQAPPPPEIQLRPLSEKRDVLRAEVAATTLAVADIRKVPASQSIEHDSEVSRGEAVTLVVTVQGCQPDAAGACNASADFTTYKPDGTVHSEAKNVTIDGGRATTALTLAATDPTGIYRVLATVRDVGARRVSKVERLFGVK